MTIESVDDLKTAIQSIIVKDYGDFKRKSILYLNRYWELQGKLSEEQQSQKNQMLWHIQYHPSGKIEPTRQWALKSIEAFESK